MDFTKYIVNGDNNGLRKYKEDGGNLNVKDQFGVSFLFIKLLFLPQCSMEINLLLIS